MDTITRTPARLRLGPFGMRSRLLARCCSVLLEWDRRARQRCHLHNLDDRALADLGLNRADIAGEVGKPFWQG